MSHQIISVAPTRGGDPETSFAAAMTVDVSKMQEYTLRALTVYKDTPVEAWKVQRQVEEMMCDSLSDSTIRTRLSELVKKGLVDEVDREGVSKTGHRCTRYQLTPLEATA